jgi:hypothetical protein
MNMDRLMQEILLFHGNKQITFTRGNNRKGSLILLPSHRHLDRFEAELLKKNSAIDTMIDMKDKARQAFVHSKIEAIQNSQVIKAKLVASQEYAKRKFKKRNPELDSGLRNTKLKVERDCSRLQTLQLVQEKPDSSLPSVKFKSS